jgi:hypothetical protein
MLKAGALGAAALMAFGASSADAFCAVTPSLAKVLHQPVLPHGKRSLCSLLGISATDSERSLTPYIVARRALLPCVEAFPLQRLPRWVSRRDSACRARRRSAAAQLPSRCPWPRPLRRRWPVRKPRRSTESRRRGIWSPKITRVSRASTPSLWGTRRGPSQPTRPQARTT